MVTITYDIKFLSLSRSFKSSFQIEKKYVRRINRDQFTKMVLVNLFKEFKNEINEKDIPKDEKLIGEITFRIGDNHNTIRIHKN